jgi:GNAT superfamily N-acetyltransferase
MSDNLLDPIYHVVRDREGHEYRLRVDGDSGLFIVKVLQEGSEIGRVQWVFHPPDQMCLGDLIIDDAVVHTPQNLAIALLQLAFKPQPVDYRRRGLGTELLRFAIAQARRRGARRIYGSLMQEDIARNPNLVDWYKKHGFHIVPPTAENVPGAVMGISMDLS